MTNRALTAEVRAFLADHSPATASEIALGVRAKPGIKERLMERVRIDSESGCWVWTGSVTGSYGGYGSFYLAGGRTLRAHRAAYELFVGPIPDGLQLDHLCQNKHCVNPAHLEPVTAAENKRRDYEARGLCRNGLHPRDEANSYMSAKGWLICRSCARAKQQRYLARKRLLDVEDVAA